MSEFLNDSAATLSQYAYSNNNSNTSSSNNNNLYDLQNEPFTSTSSYEIAGSGSPLATSYNNLSASASTAAAGAYDAGLGIDSVYNSIQQDSTVNQVAADLLALNASGVVSASGLNLADTNVAATLSTANVDLLANNGSVERKVVAYGLSEAEQVILRSNRPPQFAASEEITVNGERGLWTNKAEVVNWRGPISITQYQINQDANPEIIRKQTDQQLTYIQDIAIRYLRPPTPPAPGEIVITQQANTVIPPAPPVVIRQQPPRPITPPPLVIREAPPQAPPQVGRKVVTISGKTIPPPPRKVVIERLAPLPNKPQAVFVERWLPYSEVKRRVIFQRSNQVDPIVVKPRNVIVQWDAPRVVVKREFRNLGVIRANPAEYVSRYGASLRTVSQFPAIVASIRPPAGIILAAEHRYNTLHELYGDVQALSLINLEREGLGAYREYLAKLGVNQGLGLGVTSVSSASTGLSTLGLGLNTGSTQSIVDEIFASIDRDNNGRVSVEEAQRVLLTLNSRLGRSYGEDDIRSFFAQLDVNQDGYIDLLEFRRAFDNLLLS